MALLSLIFYFSLYGRYSAYYSDCNLVVMGSALVPVFLYYFIPTILFIAMMLNRTVLLKLVLKFLDATFAPIRTFFIKTDRNIKKVVEKINRQEFVFFTKGDDISVLNKVMLYIERNEHTRKIKIALIQENGVPAVGNLVQEIDFLDREYPEIDIEFVIRQGAFTPELIQELSKEWQIPINFMFIGSPGDRFPYRIEELGGVRLII